MTKRTIITNQPITKQGRSKYEPMCLFERLLTRKGNEDTPSLCLSIDQLPTWYEVVDYALSKSPSNQFWYSAEIKQGDVQLRVKWTDEIMNSLKVGSIVSIDWSEPITVDDGVLAIRRLVKVKPDKAPPSLSSVLGLTGRFDDDYLAGFDALND
jgi:hypothetical protein